jgi:phosphopentomutase
MIVIDSFGIGEMPDAASFGDEGSNTLLSCSKSQKFDLVNMGKLGLFNIDGVTCGQKAESPTAAYGRFAEKSMGKDTTVGHWELMGEISEKPFPTYPNGFPQSVINEFQEKTGRKVICNKPYSGTKVIEDYGRESVETGALIVYTSADSVFQIAAHESVVSVEKLYEYCEIARSILKGKHAVARVIARPFAGEYPNFVRTPNRHDFSLQPTTETVIDVLKKNNVKVIPVGKIYDIFAGKGLDAPIRTSGNTDGIKKTLEFMDEVFDGFCFVNLVDTDMLYGHRNDVDGYANALTEIDRAVGKMLEKLHDDDMLIITADHGCDPGTPSTDHSREYIPLLCCGKRIKPVNLGTRIGFDAIGAAVLDFFGIKDKITSSSFLSEVLK